MTATPLLQVAGLPGQSAEAALEAFIGWVSASGITLWPAQEEALLEIAAGSNVVLATPTGSGKSLVALGAHVLALSNGRRSYYTAPVKALVSEKFFALTEALGAANVGLVTGDASVNPGAPVVCCTAEILANLALREGKAVDLGQVVMDEVHYYGDPDRGWAWQVPMVELPQAQFILLSATLGDTTALRASLTRRTGRETVLVQHADRPVPLRYDYVLTPVHETVAELLETHQSPLYIVHSTQESAAERASALMSVPVATREQRDAIAVLIGDRRFRTKFGQTLSRWVRHGIGVHHAGMLPTYRRLVEQLAQAGLLQVVCGTDTLGVGINLPLRTVVFTALSKYDGTRTRHYSAREFHQIAGRAGRAGFDTTGLVLVEAPDHVIENERALAKVGDDPKRRRGVRRKPAPEGFVSWDAKTMERLINATPETLHSRMRITSAMLLNLAARPGDYFLHAWHLIRDNDEPIGRQRVLLHRAIELHRALLRAGVLEVLATPDELGRTVRLTAVLQADFALDRPLSSFALAAIELLDIESPGYPLDVLSVLEATLEDPRQVLAAQRKKAKGEAVAMMKADGIEYDERIELLEDITWPMPLAELLTGALDVYALSHPWVSEAVLSPKSVARDMAEQAMTFNEFTGAYGLARSEGLVLRYLADAYRALRRGVPDEAKTEELRDLTAWLGELVRQVDSSLLEEWESLRGGVPPVGTSEIVVGADDRPPPITANARAFRVLVRNAIWRRVELFARRRPDLLEEIDAYPSWSDALTDYYLDYPLLETDADARGPAMLQIETSHDKWLVRQVFADPEGDHDWGITGEVDLAASDDAGEVVLRVLHVGPLSERPV